MPELIDKIEDTEGITNPQLQRVFQERVPKTKDEVDRNYNCIFTCYTEKWNEYGDFPIPWPF
jgi:hypothetical protein